jgi:hypothetical protein
VSTSIGNNASTNFSIGAGSPNGAIAGTARDKFFDVAQAILYICTVSGTATTAIWIAVEAAIDTV